METIEQLERTCGEVKKSPLRFVASLLFCTAAAWAVLHWRYSAVIEQKDAIIEKMAAVSRSDERALQSLQNAITAKDELLFSLTNQYHRLVEFHQELSTAQTNLLDQQKKLEDVEYWARNIYANITNETFFATNRSHVLLMPSPNDLTTFVIRLSNIPLQGSLEALLKPGEVLLPQESLNLEQTGFRNLYALSAMGLNTNRTSFSFRYVVDTRKTNYYREMPDPKDVWIEPDGRIFYALPPN
jgi:hypothetical protein